MNGEEIEKETAGPSLFIPSQNAAALTGGARQRRSDPSSYAQQEVRFMTVVINLTFIIHIFIIHTEVKGESFRLLHSEEEINPLICH